MNSGMCSIFFDPKNFSGGPKGFVVTVKVWLQQNHEETPLAMPAIRLPQVSAVAEGKKKALGQELPISSGETSWESKGIPPDADPPTLERSP